jgi:hypothetical protein
MKPLLILSIILFFCVNQSLAQDASLIYKKTVNSTVTIITDDGSQGSGFFVAPNIIATNYHVMEGATKASCYLNNSDTEYKIDGYVGIDKSVDLILLKVSTLNKPAIKLAVSTASIGQKVYVIGSPRGLPATISDGIISGMRDFEGNKLLQMTASISPGSSGGPVLNSNGELLGISVSQLTDGQNLNFAIPKSYLQILLDFKKDSPIALSSLISYSASIIGKPIRIGNIEVAQNDFPAPMNWYDAKKACADLGNGWRLPTIEELTNIYLNKHKIGVFASDGLHGINRIDQSRCFLKCFYWSSTEEHNGNALCQHFNSISLLSCFKDNTYYVRAVRSF